MDNMKRSRFTCRIYLNLWAVVVLLRFGSIDGTPCDVQQTPDGTLYSVPEFKGTDCDYFWKNSTNHMLASNLNEVFDKLVVTRSDRTLLTRKCVEKIRYRQDCQEKIREAICNAACMGNAGHLENGGTTRHHWLTLAVVCILLLILLILGLIYMRRKRSHTAVKTETDGFNI